MSPPYGSALASAEAQGADTSEQCSPQNSAIASPAQPPPAIPSRFEVRKSTAAVVAPRAELADQINAEHERAFGKAREALEHARRAGELLIQVKAGLPHGSFGPWLASNVKFSERTAQAYMRLASRWDELQGKSAAVADLPLRDALGLLAEPRPERADDGFTYTPDEAALLAKARAAGGIDTLAEHRILTKLQHRLMRFALDNLEAAGAAGVNHLPPDDLRHALEICEDGLRLIETWEPDDVHLAIYILEIRSTTTSLAADIRHALAAAP